MRKFRCTQIQYDTDGQEVSLPKSLTFELSEEDYQDIDGDYDELSIELADKISEKTEFCVNSFNY